MDKPPRASPRFNQLYHADARARGRAATSSAAKRRDRPARAAGAALRLMAERWWGRRRRGRPISILPIPGPGNRWRGRCAVTPPIENRVQYCLNMSTAPDRRCRFIKVKPSLFHAREMQRAAMYAILFIDVELPNDDAHTRGSGHCREDNCQAETLNALSDGSRITYPRPQTVSM